MTIRYAAECDVTDLKLGFSLRDFARDVTPEMRATAYAEVAETYGGTSSPPEDEVLDAACRLAAQAWVDLVNAVLRARYPDVTFVPGWEIGEGTSSPPAADVSADIDYGSVFVLTGEELRAELLEGEKDG